MSNPIPTDKLAEPAMERNVLAGILSCGSELFLDIEEVLKPNHFGGAINRKIFYILQYMVHNQNAQTFDPLSILACSKLLGYEGLSKNHKDEEYLESLFFQSISKENTYAQALVVYKLAICRKAWLMSMRLTDDIESVTGQEELADIVSTIEDPVFEFTGNLMTKDGAMSQIGADFTEVLKAREENPQDIVGLSTGFPKWDQAIGGGFRRGSVNVVGARPKQGKSFFCLSVAKYMTDNNIPVLYLDTELLRTTQMDRLISLESGVDLDSVETGKFASIKQAREAVWSCQKKLTSIPLIHKNIAGQSVKSILSIARRWLVKHVGFTENGVAKPCLIIYDYLKIMDAKDIKNSLQEYQLLGFLMTSFHNFATRWELPILATVQLNRDGIEKEGSEVFSGSDRIAWLCSNLSILKRKTQEDLSEDPPKNGEKKLVVTDTRFGPGMEPGEYINVVDQLVRAKLSEGKTFLESVSENFCDNQQL